MYILFWVYNCIFLLCHFKYSVLTGVLVLLWTYLCLIVFNPDYHNRRLKTKAGRPSGRSLDWSLPIVRRWRDLMRRLLAAIE